MASSGPESLAHQRFSRRIVRAIVFLASAGALIRLLGLAKQMVVAPAFGAGPEMDAFTATESLPLLLALTLDTAVEATFVPIYVRAREAGDTRSADKAFSTLVNACLVLFGVLTILSIAGAPVLVRLSAPGFEPARLALAVSLAPLLYPLLVVNVLISLITSALNARGAFVRPMLAQAAVPLAMCASVLAFSTRVGIVALAAGELVGFVIGLGVLVIGARAAGLQYSFTLDVRSEAMRTMVRQSLPVLVGSALIHSTTFVDQVVASTLPAGQLAALSYALKLIGLPVSVVFLAFSRVVLPEFSQHVAREDWTGLRQSVRLNNWLMLILTLLMTIGAVLLGRPVIGLLFERGRFGSQDTALVTATFIAGSLGLVPMGLGFVVPRVFNALQRNDLLSAITVFSVAANATLDLILAPRLGAVGIALATSIVYLGALLIQLVVLSHVLGGFNALGLPTGMQAYCRRSLARARSSG